MTQDLRLALRTIRNNRGFAAAAVLTLALGIGANSAMFTVIRAVLLKPLAYNQPERLVKVSGGSTIAHYELIKEGQQSYSAIGAYFCCASTVSLSGPDGPVALKAAPVSANFLTILGVQPLVGRGFLPEEDLAGGPRAAMISAAVWQNRFEGDPHIAGRSATISAVPYTIVGVLPSGFEFPFAGVDVWITRPKEYSNAASPLLQPFARLKPGVTLSQASTELAVLNTQYRAAHPGMLDAKQPTVPEHVSPLKESVVVNIRATLWMLGGAVGLVLLIACANVAGLLLARATARSREFAVRSALGASRGRVIRQLLMESVLLASIGGALGLLLAFWGVRAVAGMSSLDLPRVGEIHLDGLIFAFTAALSIATGLLFGLLPALHSSRTDLASLLRASGEAASSAHRRVLLGLSPRGVLVIAQVALSMILLSGAALLIESMIRLGRVEPGFNTKNVLTMRISLPFTRYDTDAKQIAFFDELTSRVEALPGVRSAAFSFTAPLTTYALTPIRPVGEGVVPLNQRLIAMFQNITPDYFRTLEIPLRRGREFTERDDAHAPLTVILNEALARKLWPAYPNGPDPVGQRVWIGVKTNPVEVVGIVADTHQYLGVELTPAMYRPLAQSTSAGAFLVRTEGDPLHFANAVRAQIQAIDRDQAATEVKSLEELFAADAGHNRPILSLLAGFAAVALMLALTGLYGVIAYSVAQRTQEVGIRRALGARHSDILGMVLGQGLALSTAGIVLGIGGGIALTRFLKSFLFEISPTDPVTFAVAAVMFLAVALAACYVPARRAARIDPMVALR